jgi:serine/threonine-protein kinase
MYKIMAEIKLGQEIGRYKIVGRLGRGGMAEVYKGYQESLDRYVAIKLMHTFLVTEQDFLARFQREARAIAKLNHPNIVGVYDFDTLDDDTYYLVMEYISGGTLKDRLQELAAQGEHLPLEDAIRITSEITSALAYAHKRGMIHRDIKPANIMLTDIGKAVLTDFGIVKLVGGAHASAAFTATGALIGTPAYMSPEQALGKPGDERADIYSLGVMLFQMVTGKLPFDADTPLAVVMKHVNEAVPLPISFNPDVPFRLQEVILKALEKDPDRRYQSADEMVSALQRVHLVGEGARETMLAEVSLPVSSTEVIQLSGHETTSGGIAASLTAVMPHEGGMTGTLSAASVALAGTAVASPRHRSSWLYGAVGLIAVLAIGGFIFFNGRSQAGTTPTPAPVVVVVENTTTPTPTESGSEETATITPTPSQTPDIVASSVAAIAQTAEAKVTITPTPSRTATGTPVDTPDATAAFLEDCTVEVELVEAHPYQNNNSNFAPVSLQFPMYWIVRNSGTCPWPADLQWVYVEGETFDQADEPLPLDLEVEVLPDEEIEITTTFVAPANVATFESTWQLVDADEEPFGPPLTFEIRTYIPATPTLAPTSTPAATPTTEVEVTELNYLFEVLTCQYLGVDWSCHVRLTPFGGTGGPYTTFVFDQPAGQATRFDGPGPHSYFALARRCASFNQNVRIIDDGVTPALEFNRHLFIDPDNYIPGGCVEE